MDDLHMGRSWTGHEIEDACPCPKERCGLVSAAKADPECPQHGPMKTMRQMHFGSECPARPALVRWAIRQTDAISARRDQRRQLRAARWKFDWRHPKASLEIALGFGPNADGQAQWEIVSRLRWAASHYLCIGQWFWDGKDNCWRCDALPSDVDFLMRRVGFRRAECIDTDGDCRLYADELAPDPEQEKEPADG